jgi:hypothetical protein
LDLDRQSAVTRRELVSGLALISFRMIVLVAKVVSLKIILGCVLGRTEVLLLVMSIVNFIWPGLIMIVV